MALVIQDVSKGNLLVNIITVQLLIYSARMALRQLSDIMDVLGKFPLKFRYIRQTFPLPDPKIQPIIANIKGYIIHMSS